MTAIPAHSNTFAAQLARYVARLRYEDLPADVIASAKTLVLDQLACELIGSTLPWVRPALDLVDISRGAREESTVVNHGGRFPAAEAAFVNATFGQACEMDDFAAGSSGHIGTATVPVALAAGERERASGRQFLVAMIAGYEVMYRLMQAVSPHAEIRGFHSQSIAGPFAAAAVAGKLSGLDAERMAHALAIAGSHSSGSTEYDQSGGEVKRIHAGLGARGGVHATLLAGFGLTGPSTIIEGKRGFLRIFSDKADPSRVTEGLGETFAIRNASYKMFPTVGALHTTIVAVGKLVAEHGLVPRDIGRVRVGLSEQAYHHAAGIARPRDVIGAQFSLAYSVALAIAGRGHDLQNYMDPALWEDAELLSLMDRVEAYAHPVASGELRRYAAVELVLKDGRRLEAVEEYMRGSPKNPASQADLDAKVRRLAGTVLPPDRVQTLVEMVGRLETVGAVNDLAALLVAGHSK